ncbi:hypothetical protein D9M69_723290 [compost metagenome]
MPERGLDVARVDAGGGDLDQHLAGTRPRHGDIDDIDQEIVQIRRFLRYAQRLAHFRVHLDVHVIPPWNSRRRA